MLCSANRSTDVGDYEFVVASIHAAMAFLRFGSQICDGKGRDWLMQGYIWGFRKDKGGQLQSQKVLKVINHRIYMHGVDKEDHSVVPLSQRQW